MGNAGSRTLPARLEGASTQGQALVGKEMLYRMVDLTEELGDFYSWMRCCRLLYNYCQQESSWRLQLARLAAREYAGRLGWVGYALLPPFIGPKQPHTDSDGLCFPVALPSPLPPFSRADLFRSKRVIRQRFDLFSGWGSLLQHHFIEGFFQNGSLLLGTLYDMTHEPPRIVYSGHLFKGKRHGPLGVSFYPDGARCYQGSWDNDEMHGMGVTFWKNGSQQYRGQFQHGVKEGLGTQQWATGEYEGEWHFNAPHGRGCWRWTDGKKFVGCMVGGKREGFGILFYPTDNLGDAKVEYEGEWKDDQLCGQNKHYDRSGVLRFEGNFLNGLKHGPGKSFKNLNGRAALSYEGEYFAGKKEGYGTKYNPLTGSILYRGNWKKSMYHGTGSMGAHGPTAEYKHGHAVSKEALDESFSMLELEDGTT